MGFEPMNAVTHYQFSGLAPSTTRPTLHKVPLSGAICRSIAKAGGLTQLSLYQIMFKKQRQLALSPVFCPTITVSV